MTLSAQERNDLERVVVQLWEGQLTPDEGAWLKSRLTESAEARRLLAGYNALVAILELEIPTLADDESGATDPGHVEYGASERHPLDTETGTPGGLPISVLGSLSAAHQGTAGFFSAGWPVAYLIATVIFSIGLVIGSFVHVSQPGQVAEYPGQLSPADGASPTAVARITQVADCRWAKGVVPLAVNDIVPIGHEVKLESGLMEIVYNSGARVVLQGPVAYSVESTAGGYLGVGRLTARVDVNLKSEIRNPKSETISKSPNLQISKFVVRTPTATVTDLGTEFGVEVDKRGYTTSHVFRGSVKLQSLGPNAKKEGDAIVLHEGEAARMERSRNDSGAGIVMRRISGDAKDFVRHIVRTPKTVDLLDIVAGGNGLGHLREHGIDPTTGMQDPVCVSGELAGDGKYHPVPWRSKLIDGVFIPDGGSGPVVLDSAGHAFGGFPHTAGSTFGSIWARAAESYSPTKGPWSWVHGLGRGEQFMPEHRGLLCMHANAGITFDLEAMRQLYSGGRPVRFRAVAGLSKANTRTYTAKFNDNIQGWDAGGDGPYWRSTGGQDGGGYAGGVRNDMSPYLTPPSSSILCGDVPGNFGSQVLRFSYYLKNFSGSPDIGGALYMFADCDGDGNWDTVWQWTPSDTSVPHEWRQYSWTVDAAAGEAPAGWTRHTGSGSWADSWRHVKLWNFWETLGSGQVNNGIDTMVVSSVPDASAQLADIWVFVDGQLKLQREQLRPKDGVVPVDVEIGPRDRFLTIVSTDGGKGNGLDWVVFGDPVLDVTSVEDSKQ